LVHHITVYRPQTGQIFDLGVGVNFHIHFGLPRATVDTGASLWIQQAVIDTASRQAACAAPSHLDLKWDIRTFELHESSLAPIPSPSGAESGEAGSRTIRMSPGELADDAARKACSSALGPSGSEDWSQAETALGMLLRKSRSVGQSRRSCTGRSCTSSIANLRTSECVGRVPVLVVSHSRRNLSGRLQIRV
jgi:hypothetical protein